MAKRIIKPDSGNTLVLQEDNGSIDALTVETNGDVTLAGNFTSKGIDDNASTTALTINSSGNTEISGILTVDTVDFVKFQVLDTTNSRVPFAIGSGASAVTIENDVSVGQSHEYIAFQEADSSLRFGTLGTERMRIDSSGNVELKTTNAKLILPSGGGISFENHSTSTATGASSTAAANVLDDYEEGTWTPQFVDSSGSNDCAAANASNGAYYTKIGNLVTCSFRWNASGGTAVNAYLRGIPFSPSSTSGKSKNVVILANDSEGITYWRNDGSDAFTLVGKQLSGLSAIFRAQFSYFTD